MICISRSPRFGVPVAIILLAIATAHASAGIVAFQNPAGPGHFDWFPASGEFLNLDITLPANAQPGVNNGTSSFRHTNVDVLGQIEGVPGITEVQGGGIHPALLLGTNFGEPVPPVALPANFNWNNSSAISHPALGSNLVDGQQAYLGVRFDLGSGWQYGWIGVVKNGIGLDAFAWAYETDPGMEIAAGVVPEPGSLALLAFVAVGVAGRRRRA